MVADIVSLFCDSSHEIGIPVCLSPNKKKRCPNAVAAEHIEHTRCVNRMRTVVERQTHAAAERPTFHQHAPRTQSGYGVAENLTGPGHIVTPLARLDMTPAHREPEFR